MDNGSQKANINYSAEDAYFEMQISGPHARPIAIELHFGAETQKYAFLQSFRNMHTKFEKGWAI